METVLRVILTVLAIVGFIGLLTSVLCEGKSCEASHSASDDFVTDWSLSPANPANPASPLSPINPLNPNNVFTNN